MNASKFVEVVNNNATFNNFNADSDYAEITVLYWVLEYVRPALGIPGNILSATVWLRLHKKNSSVVYLAALAITDLAFLLCDFSFH